MSFVMEVCLLWRSIFLEGLFLCVFYSRGLFVLAVHAYVYRRHLFVLEAPLF